MLGSHVVRLEIEKRSTIHIFCYGVQNCSAVATAVSQIVIITIVFLLKQLAKSLNRLLEFCLFVCLYYVVACNWLMANLVIYMSTLISILFDLEKFLRTLSYLFESLNHC